MEDRPVSQYGLSDYDPIPFSYFSQDFGKLSVMLSQPYDIDITTINLVQNFLSQAESLWSDLNPETAEQFSSHPAYDVIRTWVDEKSAKKGTSDSSEGKTPVVPGSSTRRARGRRTLRRYYEGNTPVVPSASNPLLSTDQREKLRELSDNLTSVYETIKNIISGYDHQKQITYDSFKNLTPLIEGFVERERSIIPDGVRNDWNEAIKCLNYGQFRAGSMMTFRAAEGMLQYYYWNMTGELPEKPVIDRNKNTILIKMGWQDILDKLNEKGLDDITLTNNLENAQKRRNAFAHGNFFSFPTNPETALKNYELCKGVIQGLVTSLLNRKKALRVCIKNDITFDTALALWMLHKYFGVVDTKYLRKGANIDKWYSYIIGLGGKYDQIPNSESKYPSVISGSQMLFSDLCKWNVITTHAEKRRLQSMIDYANNNIDYSTIDEDDLNIHSLINYINKLSNGDTVKGYSDSLKLIGKVYDEYTKLDQPQQMEKLRYWVGVAI